MTSLAHGIMYLWQCCPTFLTPWATPVNSEARTKIHWTLLTLLWAKNHTFKTINRFSYFVGTRCRVHLSNYRSGLVLFTYCKRLGSSQHSTNLSTYGIINIWHHHTFYGTSPHMYVQISFFTPLLQNGKQTITTLMFTTVLNTPCARWFLDR